MARWKKTPVRLIELLDENISEFDCQKKMMFGYPVYFVNNNMFAGTHQENIFLRFSDKDKKKILSSNSEVSPFEPIKGRIMKEYVVLPGSILKNKKVFREWLIRSYSYVSTLPPKEKKKAKKKK
ncbi:MAG: TfoX/Sxy family protein [Candidatus Aminicenantes bacterium]|nr:MAG: TfoX/Sxy family protein [Candidatus Aminicenantes bacterium]